MKYEEPIRSFPRKGLAANRRVEVFVDHLDTGIEIVDGQSGYEVVVLEKVHGLITQSENIEKLT